MLWATEQDVVEQMNRLSFSILMSIFAVSSGSTEFQSRKYSHKGLLSRGQRAISRHADSVNNTSLGHSFIHLSTNANCCISYIYHLKGPMQTIIEAKQRHSTTEQFLRKLHLIWPFNHLSAWRAKGVIECSQTILCIYLQNLFNHQDTSKLKLLYCIVLWSCTGSTLFVAHVKLGKWTLNSKVWNPGNWLMGYLDPRFARWKRNEADEIASKNCLQKSGNLNTVVLSHRSL